MAANNLDIVRGQEHYQLSFPNLYKKQVLWLSNWTSFWMIQLDVYLGGPNGRPFGRANVYINAGTVARIVSRFE